MLVVAAECAVGAGLAVASAFGFVAVVWGWGRSGRLSDGAVLGGDGGGGAGCSACGCFGGCAKGGGGAKSG